MTLGQEIRSRRRDLGLLQSELAEISGVSERFIRAVEHDKETVRLDKLRVLLEALGLELHAVVRKTPGVP